MASNALTLAIAWWEQWPLVLLLWPYWGQSVVIGWYSAKRMLALDGGQPKLALDHPILEGTQGQVSFFLLHYGFFHFAYLFFLWIFTVRGVPGHPPAQISSYDAAWIAGLIVLFAFTHRTSFQRNLEADQRGAPRLDTLMLLPYARVVPMQLTILVGMQVQFAWAVLLFGALKTVADVLMHVVEHRVLGARR